jgi:hypothetical protein
MSLFQAGFRDIQTGRGHFHNNPIRDFLIIGIIGIIITFFVLRRR